MIEASQIRRSTRISCKLAMVWKFSCVKSGLKVIIYNRRDRSVSFIYLIFKLIIVAHIKLYIIMHTITKIVFSKHEFNYNCEIVFSKHVFINLTKFCVSYTQCVTITTLIIN